MKKKMQKYLSNSNEGFSLVELIIVIAIMAILIGVVALAVIPNLERSRESKDLAALDDACKALTAAVATAGSKATSGTATISGGTLSCDDTDMKALIEDQIDVSSLKLVSKAAGGDTIDLEWDVTAGKNISKASANGGAECKYAKDASGDTAKLIVSAGDSAAAEAP